MKQVHLRSIGEIDSKLSAGTTDESESIVRDAMLVYCGTFESMDGPVKITDKIIEKLCTNFNDKISKLAAGGAEIPAKNYPPIQLDHSTSAHDTIGRVVGPLKVGEYEGKKALFGVLKFIGGENVKKVSDGRWTHLSIGADLDDGILNELTVTPFPAAPNASLLRGAKLKKENVKEGEILGTKFIVMHVIPDDPKERAHFAVEGIEGLSAKFDDAPTAVQAAEEHIRRIAKGKPTNMSGGKMDKEKLKKHLMEKEKLSEEDAEKKMAAMSEEEHEKLSAEADEHEKKMKAEADEAEAKAKMSKAKEEFAKLSAGFRSNAKTAQLAQKKISLTSRLSSYRSKAKITPAEIKKIDVSRLAAKSDEAIEAFFESIEQREPQILVGAVGTQKAENLAKLQKMKANKDLEDETLSHMPFTQAALSAGKKRLSNEQPDKAEPTDGGGPTAEDGGTQHPMSKGHMADMLKHLEAADAAHEAGNHGEAREHMKMCMDKMKAHMSYMSEGTPEHEIPMHEDAEEKMSALSKSVKKMESQFEEMVALMAPVLGIEA